MKGTYKRILSILLVLAMLAAFLPAGMVTAAESVESGALTDADYRRVDAVFAQIEEMENAPAKKNSTQTELTDGAVDIVTASDSYVEGSLVRNGDSFTWETDFGIRCVYSPRMRKINEEMEAPAQPEADGIYNEPTATKGGWPSGNQVYLVGPYYGYDSDFTDQYKNEAAAIAKAIGDTDGYTLYSGMAATVDKVAEAVSKGAVVIFDSHGNTDYESGYDYVTGATSSYLCLKSTSGLTTEDYDDGALYDPTGIWINGATIANHMTTNSPGGILWMAICLGMATDTICEPLRAKGVEVVYGYSQSVTFAGDYLFEETFWDEMCSGATVADATAVMKAEWGEWDWSTKIATYYGYDDGYSTIAAARADYSAFPVVVSDEDAHPGQRNRNTFYGADSLQTVKSTYTLFSQYNVSVQVNNSAWGSAAVNGNTVTATPAAGYFAQSCTVVSGNASVSQNGNAFVVNAQSDCVVQVNFAAKTAVTVNFSGAAVASQTGYAGDSMTLPTVAAPEGYTFLGWMDSPLTGNTTEKPACYTASFTPTGNTTLYALFSFVEESAGGSGDYVKVTSTPGDWSGEYLIVYEDGSLILDGSLTAPDAANNYQSVTISDGTISAVQGDPYKFTIEEYSGGYAIKGTSGLYIGCATNANLLSTGTSAMKNTLSLDASGNANIIGSGGAYLRYNDSASRFRYYKSGTYSNQKPVALYLKDGSAGITWYTGTTTVCEHPAPTTVEAVAPTCTQPGLTAGLYCADCDSYISGCEAVAALGHSYSAQVIAPTVSQQGYTVYTCTRCGDSYIGDYVEALGETYTVSFVVPHGVAAIADLPCGKNGITLPTAEVPAGEYSYVFLGWTTGRVDNATQKPEIYSGSFTAKEDTMLYAIYSYVVDGTGAEEYVLTDLADIKATDKVVITVEYDGTVYAMNNINGSGTPPYGVTVSVTADGGVSKLASMPADSLLWNIGGQPGAYIIYPNGKTDSWVYCNTTNNGVRVGTGSNKTFSIVDDYLYNNGTDRYIGVYRTNPDWRCYTSINSNIQDEVLGFYVLGSSGTTYYTTEFTQPCEHNYSYTLENGLHTFTCSDCGDVITKESTDGKQLKFRSAAPLLGDCINVEFGIEVPAGFENVYVVFEFIGKQTRVDSYYVNAAGRYVFEFPGINPQTIGENIRSTVYATVDGVEVSLTYATYSVRTYCGNQLTKTTVSAALKTLIADLLIFGEKTQIVQNYKTDELITAGMDLTPYASTFAPLGTEFNKQAMVGTANPNVGFKSVTLTLSGKMTIVVSLTADDISKYTFQAEVNGVVTTYQPEDLVYNATNGRYELSFDKMKASAFDDVITFSILENGVVTSKQLQYSVNSYIQKNQAVATGDMLALLQAIYNYGAAAKALNG